MDTYNDIYRQIHFAVMAIESGACKYVGNRRQGDVRPTVQTGLIVGLLGGELS